jgi:alpha-tubulin suppressor-like RCC1 family protein
VWGKNGSGQLGLGSYTSTNVPQQALISDVQSLAVGSAHVVALKSDGTVWAWGHNFNGQITGAIGIPYNAPFQITSITNALEVYAGTIQSYALLSDGTFNAWGYNNDGLIGSSIANWNAAVFTTADQLCSNTISIENVDSRYSGFEVYPNPSSGAFYIQTDSPGTFELYDLMGKKLNVFDVEGTTQVQTILPSGMYIIRQSSSSQNQLIVIE